MRQCDGLQDRMERLATIEAGLGPQPPESLVRWREEQNTSFLSMPLGRIDEAVPTLLEMAVVTKSSAWIEETCEVSTLEGEGPKIADFDVGFFLRCQKAQQMQSCFFDSAMDSWIERSRVPWTWKGQSMPTERFCRPYSTE